MCDTNVLVRLLVADDPAQTRRALSFLKAHGPLWVSTVVLVETFVRNGVQKAKPKHIRCGP